MRNMLLGLAAVVGIAAIPASPALALDPTGFTATSNAGSVRIHRGEGESFRRGGFTVNRDDRRDRRRDDGVIGTWIDGGEWALYNNRTWESDSYNDWWHDQPWRSYPKWVTTNQNCERQWWSGSGWRC